MTTIHEHIETRLDLEPAFAHVADFANASTWDPGTASSERVDPGPVGVGARYHLGVRIGGRVAPMTYRIATFEPPHRVVLIGSGSGVSAVDDIRFEHTGSGTRIDYRADVRLGGLLGLFQPFLGGRFEKIGRDAAAGMRRTLDDLADVR
jgi:carbon monoxide dehydrogenase subunit G